MSVNTTVTIRITVKDKTVDLTVGEARQLRDQLSRLVDDKEPLRELVERLIRERDQLPSFPPPAPAPPAPSSPYYIPEPIYHPYGDKIWCSADQSVSLGVQIDGRTAT